MKPTISKSDNRFRIYGKPGYPRFKNQPEIPIEDRVYCSDGTYIHKLDVYNMFLARLREGKEAKISL